MQYNEIWQRNGINVENRKKAENESVKMAKRAKIMAKINMAEIISGSNGNENKASASYRKSNGERKMAALSAMWRGEMA
jgi:hypothetical protein